jgi:hypothetical protein
MNHIFISYSSKNRTFALKLADNLERFYNVWIDREGIKGGLEWEQAIEDAIKDCAVFLVIVTPESNESDWVARETIRAEQLDKYRIPVLVEGVLPLRLLNLHFIDFQGKFEGGFRDLLEVLQGHLDPEDKQQNEVEHLIGEGVLARLEGDYPQSNSLIGQALVLQPEICKDTETFWEMLQTVNSSNQAKELQELIANGYMPIVEQTKSLAELPQLPSQFMAHKLPELPKSDSPQYAWSIQLDVPAEILDNVDYVKYQLHETFKSPVRTIRNRKDNFQLTAIGWGTFNIPVEIYFKDGSVAYTNYDLQLNT